MNQSDCICFAKDNLHTARLALKTGHCINYVADDLGSAVMWAMEAWLMAHGHDYIHAGWGATQTAFAEHGPADLYQRARKRLLDSARLEYALLGDPDDPSPPLPLAEWKIKANDFLEQTERVVNDLLAECGGH